ncbi:tRNA(Ile)-lysidine synthase [Candidatus Terasakiella magnetica]|nr:tRNA(Ile)-lysidine synthase [Candidatus Terasakiella magnetica]
MRSSINQSEDDDLLLNDDDFTALMAPLGPFERVPRLALGVSGGADSLALALLAARWAERRGGDVVALTVDHGLRPESGVEAAQVAGWLAAHRIRHEILVWEGDKPGADLQAAARDARRALLGGYCARHGILHLLLAHHREDQAETFLLRLARGSGVDGLAAMALAQPTHWGRILRPLLAVPRARLAATLIAQGQTWIEDPSNRNAAFARVRMRRLAFVLAAEGLTAPRLAATAGHMARARAALEQAVADAAAARVEMHEAGYAWLDLNGLAHLPEEVGLRLLSRLLGMVGGGAYGPRLERLERLWAEFSHGLETARTLGGCRVVPEKSGRVLICREPAKMEAMVSLSAGNDVFWDGRFRVRCSSDLPPGYGLGGLGGEGWRKITALVKPARLPAVPAAARPSLPALYGEDGISAVPHLGYNRGDAGECPVVLEAAPAIRLTMAGRLLVVA